MPKHQKSQYYAVPTLVMTTPLIVSRDVRVHHGVITGCVFKVCEQKK